jgi:hypothetical protein
MIFRVSHLARARVNGLVAQASARRYASSQVTTSSAKPSALTLFARGWYNLYVVCAFEWDNGLVIWG